MEDKRMLIQAFTITIGSILSRVIGLIYVFPFAHLVGQEGQALYSYAYTPYVIFIDLATLGIPLGIAKFISIYNAQGNYLTSYKTFKSTLLMMLGIGLTMCLALFLLAKPIAYQILGGQEAIHNNITQVIAVIRIIALALIVVPIIAVMRGFFQGFKKPNISVLSQLLEQLTRVLFIIISSFLLIKVFHKPYYYAVYFAVASALVAAVVAYFVLRINLGKYQPKLEEMIKKGYLNKQLDNIKEKSTSAIYQELFKYALPISFFGLISSLYLFIDTLTFNKAYLLRGEGNSEIIYGTYAFEINKLIMIPVTVGIGLGVSLIVYISEAYTLRYYKIINRQINKALQTCFFIIMPFIMLMMIFNKGVYSFFYDYRNVYGSKILLSYAPVVILLCFNHITSSILQGINKERYLVISMLAGICFKYLYNEPLIIKLGYNGAILSTVIGLLITILSNFFIMAYTIKHNHVYLVRRLLIILIINLVLGSCFYLFNFYILSINYDITNKLSCFIYVGINTFVYLILYLLVCYYLGVLDVILGRKCDIKNLISYIKRKTIPNGF